LLDEILFDDRVFFYRVLEHKAEVIRRGAARLVTGRAVFVNTMTTEARKVSFAVLHAGGIDLTAGAIYGYTDNLEYIKESFNFGEMQDCKALIKGSFVETLGMKDLLKERQRQMLASEIEKAKKRIRANFVTLFEQERAVLSQVQNIGLPMPKLFLNLSEFVINAELKEEFLKTPLKEPRVEELLGRLKNISGKLDGQSVKYLLTKKLDALAAAYAADPLDLHRAGKMVDLLGFARAHDLPLTLYNAQNVVFKTDRTLPAAVKESPVVKVLRDKLDLNLS
jgi:hypothetical protein